MRTILDIDHDVLEAAQEISVRTRRTAGEVLSDLARVALSAATPLARGKAAVVNGFEILPAEGRVVTAELVQNS
ncbi:MAG: hypothetical protein U0984_03615 [Prosthecobacter sp.]|nr:hypothetical protein [Prosthecobacter sp.]